MSHSDKEGGTLSGTTVLAVEQAVAAPFATRQLADLGARVIKVERPDGDFARRYDRRVGGESSFFVWLNRGKESIAVDLRSEDGRAFLNGVLPRVDVLVQNLVPGAAERLGVGPELAERYPGLVHVSISGYGEGGPMGGRKAYDLLVQGEAGLLAVTGSAHAPAKVGISIADIAAGVYAFSGVLTALLERERTGRGAVLDVSLLDALAEWMSQPVNYAAGGPAPVPTGASHPTIAPYGPFPTADGRLLIAVQNEREWTALCERVLDAPGLVLDARFADNVARTANRAALDALIAERTVLMPGTRLEAALDAACIANARLRPVETLRTHPQLAARARWRLVQTPGGPAAALLPPVTVQGREPVMRDVPALGQHTIGLLAEFAGRPSTDGSEGSA